MEECAVNESIKSIRNDFDKARKNMDFMEKGLQFVESYFTDKNFPGWKWSVYTRGTFQNKPYFEIEGTSRIASMNTEYATISLKYNCCNKTTPALVIQNIIPELNVYMAYRDKMDPILKTFEGMRFKNSDPFIPQLAKILTDIKKKEDVNNGALKLKSLIKQIQLKKDF